MKNLAQCIASIGLRVQQVRRVRICLFIVGIIFLSGEGVRAAATIERVQRDFQARQNLASRVFTGTDYYITWPGCRQGKTPAPRFPKDGFYGDLAENPQFAVTLVQHLATQIWGWYASFVDAPSGFGDLEGVAIIDEYQSGDPRFWPQMEASDVTTNNYMEKLEILASRVAKFNLVRLDVSQVQRIVDGERRTEDSSLTSCATTEQCIQGNHPLAAWDTWTQFDQCNFLDALEDYFDNGRIGLQFETVKYGRWRAAALNRRGKIKVDFTPFPLDEGARPDSGVARIYLKLAPVPLDSDNVLFWFLSGVPGMAYSSGLGQNRPVSGAVGTNYGWWPGGAVKLGNVWTSDYVTYSDSNPSPIGSCLESNVTISGWQIDDHVVVIQAETPSPDPDDCCGCTQCEPGTLTTALGSLNVSIALGGDNFGGSAGSLRLMARQPGGSLSTPSALRYSVASTVELIPASGNPKLQFKTSQALVNIVTNGIYKYTMAFYTATDAGTTNASGFYQPTGSPYRTITIENPDTTAATNRLQVTDVSDGATNITEYAYASAHEQWTLTTGGGLRKETKSSVWDGGQVNRTETLAVTNISNQLVYKELNVYTLFGWGEERTTNIVDPDGAALTSRWSYYTNSATDGGNYRKLKEEISATGHWVRYEYDQHGRETNRVIQFLNAAPGAAENSSRVISTTYSTNVPHITIVEKLLGTEIGRQYKVTGPGELRNIQCQSAGAAWNASDNLVMVTKRYTTGSFAGEPFRVSNPDGTVQIHLYSTNATEKTTVLLAGAADPASETNILRGTITTTVTGRGGEIRSRIVKSRMPGPTDFTVEQDIYTYLDARNRSYRVVHLDGTTNQFNFACCGLESEIDRDETVTSYIYDRLKRQIGSVLHGITTTNLLDPTGAILKTVRVGSDGTAMTLSSASYDLAGRMTNSVDALGQTTTYRETNDSSGLSIRITTYPDGGAKVETFAKDGTLLKLTGSAVRPVRHTNWVETSGPDAGRFYSEEIKLTSAGADTAEWTRRYFDVAGRVYKTSYPEDSYARSYFNAKGQLLKQSDNDGRTTSYIYNDLGQVHLTAIDMDWDADHQIELAGMDRIVDITNDVATLYGTTVLRTREFVWLTNGVNASTLMATRETSADGLRTWAHSFGVTNRSHTRFAGGGVRYVTNTFPAGNYELAKFEYGRLAALTQHDSNGLQAGGTTYGYDAHGRQSTVTDARSGATTFTFNNGDQVSSVTTPSPVQVTTNYFDGMGRIWKIGLPDATSVTNEYYLTGDLKKTTGARTYPVEYSYDAQGRLTTMTTWTSYPNVGAATTQWRYDARGFMTNKLHADGSGPIYTYTPAGLLGTVSSPLGYTTYFEYNGAAEPTAIDYSATEAAAFSYDRAGRLIQAVLHGARPVTNVLVRDLAGRLLSETFNGITVTNTYDSWGRRTSLSVMSHPSTLVQFGYDAASRVSSITNGAHSVAYSYLGNSPVATNLIFKQSGTTRLATTKFYDNLNRLTRMTNMAGSVVGSAHAYGLNAANQRTSLTNADNSRWAFGYDYLGQVTSGKRYWSDGAIVAGQQFEYAFDDIGNRKVAASGGDEWGANLRYQTYSVNNLNQQTQRSVPRTLDVVGVATSAATVTVNDVATMRKGEYYRAQLTNDNSAAALYLAITNLAVLKNCTNSDIVTNITGNLFVPRTPETFAYDADGNLTNDGRWILTWDAENRLMAAEARSDIPSTARQKLAFQYDYRGRRVGKVVSNWNGSAWVLLYETRFVYDDWNLLAELNSTNGFVQSYLWGLDLSGSMHGAGGVGGLLAVNNATSGVHFAACDGNGNVVTLVDASSSTVSATYEYGPFGEVIRLSGPMAKLNPIRWSSKFHDDETNFDYYGDRYLDHGRWLGRDSIGELGGENLNGFVFNNPASHVDTDGRAVLETAAVVTTATASSGGGVTLTLTASAGSASSGTAIGAGVGAAPVVVIAGIVVAGAAAVGFVAADINQAIQIVAAKKQSRQAAANIQLQEQLLAEAKEDKPELARQPQARGKVAEGTNSTTCCRWIWDREKRGGNPDHDAYTARLFTPDYELIVVAPDGEWARYDSGSRFPKPVTAGYEAKTGRRWAYRVPRAEWIPRMEKTFASDTAQFTVQQRVATKCKIAYTIYFQLSETEKGYRNHAPLFQPHYTHRP